MRAIISSNSMHVGTGYGQQSKFLVRIFQELGHDVVCAPHWGVQGGFLNIDGVVHLPPFRDMWQVDMMFRHVQATEADFVLNLHDCWVLPPGYASTLGVPWVAYAPVDSTPANPMLSRIMREAKYPVTMSLFGVQELKRSGVNARYIPHAVNTNVFKPGDKLEARRELGIPEDCFLALMVAANQGFPSRKAFPEQLSAFAQFRKSHPDAKLLLHTQMQPFSNQGGVDLHQLIAMLDLQEHVYNTPEYDIAVGVPEERMALLYQSADVLMNASYAGGFELALIEAQACGVPVITHAFSAMTELCFYGRAVPSIQKFFHPHGCWQAIPSIPAIVEALNQAYAKLGINETRSSQVVEKIQQEFSYEAVRDKYWASFLEEIDRDIESSKLPESKEKEFDLAINGLDLKIIDDRRSLTPKSVELELSMNEYGLENREIPPNGIIVDIGAHVGIVSVYLAKKFPQSKILAYEAHPLNFQRLLRNLELNNITNVEAKNLAVTSDSRDFTIALNPNNTGGASGMLAKMPTDNRHLISVVKSTTLDEIFDSNGIKACDLLKVDCEGCEYEILENFKSLSIVKAFAGELHVNKNLISKGYSPSKLWSMLKEHIEPQNIHCTTVEIAE